MITIAYEVDIQNDFMNSDGSAYVPKAETLKPKIIEIVNFVKKNNIRRISSRDRHFLECDELMPNGGLFAFHCMDPDFEHKTRSGKLGINVIEEIAESDENIFVFEHKRLNGSIARYRDDDIEEIIKSNKSIVFEKQTFDVFSNPLAEKIFKLMKVKNAIVYGVATDYCIKAAVIGLQNIGIQCLVVKDAIAGIKPKATEKAIAEMQEKGAKFISLEELLKYKF